jgi:hypothetical protein
VAEQGWSHVIIDGKLFRTDRVAETTTSAKGATINTWYAGKHRAFGANIQAVMRPDGLPIWTSEVMAGHHHDITAARAGVLSALYWAASQLQLPTLADGGYEGAGIGVHPPIRQPTDNTLAADHQTYNALHRGVRAVGERGFALLTGPLARPSAHHRKPIQDRQHRRRRADTHPIRASRPTPILLRSPQ